MDKLGSYITQLMTTVIDKEQEQIVKDLALDELKRLITVNNIEDLLKMNIDRGDVKNFRELVPEYETINIISDELSKMDVENKRKSFINFFPYLLKEIYLIIMKSNRETLFRAFSNKDEKIIKKFSIN